MCGWAVNINSYTSSDKQLLNTSLCTSNSFTNTVLNVQDWGNPLMYSTAVFVNHLTLGMTIYHL